MTHNALPSLSIAVLLAVTQPCAAQAPEDGDSGGEAWYGEDGYGEDGSEDGESEESLEDALNEASASLDEMNEELLAEDPEDSDPARAAEARSLIDANPPAPPFPAFDPHEQADYWYDIAVEGVDGLDDLENSCVKVDDHLDRVDAGVTTIRNYHDEHTVGMSGKQKHNLAELREAMVAAERRLVTIQRIVVQLEKIAPPLPPTKGVRNRWTWSTRRRRYGYCSREPQSAIG